MEMTNRTYFLPNDHCKKFFWHLCDPSHFPQRSKYHIFVLQKISKNWHLVMKKSGNFISGDLWEHCQYYLSCFHLRVAPTQAVRHDLSRGLPMHKSKLTGYLRFCAFEKWIVCACYYVYVLMLNKLCQSPSWTQIFERLTWQFLFSKIKFHKILNVHRMTSFCYQIKMISIL